MRNDESDRNECKYCACARAVDWVDIRSAGGPLGKGTAVLFHHQASSALRMQYRKFPLNRCASDVHRFVRAACRTIVLGIKKTAARELTQHCTPSAIIAIICYQTNPRQVCVRAYRVRIARLRTALNRSNSMCARKRAT